MNPFDVHDEDALLDRLTNGIKSTDQQVVFLVGSALTAPRHGSTVGVPSVEGVINLIREEFKGPLQGQKFETALEDKESNRYQSAFRYLLGHRGQQIANEVIRRAVWQARKSSIQNEKYIPSKTTSEEVCRSSDEDLAGWLLPSAIESVGALIAGYPHRFGKVALTTNFDPLLEVSIAHAGGIHFRTVLHGDGNIGQTEGTGCHVIHLHGYWHGADTLHTPKQLSQPIVFTCRPTIQYSNSAVLCQKLGGLSFDSAKELFLRRGAQVNAHDMESAHSATAGHAFWLDLLAAQLVKNSALKIADLLDRPDRDVGDIPLATLQSIWKTLSQRDQIVLQALAESVRPETEPRLGNYLSSQLHYAKVVKALKSLRSLNLIVVKPHPDTDDVVELHPLVRNFVHRNFGKSERLPFITAIIEVYRQFLGIHKSELAHRPRLDVLQNWTQAAELAVEAGRFGDAFSCLNDVGFAFEGGGFPGEYARVARALFEKVDWAKHHEIKSFDYVLKVFVHILVELGRFDEAQDILAKFHNTMPVKDARYILFCELKCYLYWAKGEFAEAIDWGKAGVELKGRSQVDTTYSSSHSLALAQRDSGDIDPALKEFLAGRALSEIIDPEELDEKLGGHFYGNIGRCLQKMGQIDPAIICYRKSAILIEKNSTQEHVVNQGFIRRWIGELLLMKGDFCAAKQFIEAAIKKWEQVSPLRAKDLRPILEKNTEAFVNCPNYSPRELERYCVAWIYGREIDFH